MKKLIVSLIFICVSSTNASTISHYGYSLDTTNNIVTSADGSMEWLQWTQTQNMSAADVTAFAAGTGWQLATSAQITELYEDFFPFSGSWNAEESFYIHNAPVPLDDIQQRTHNFESLFGITAKEPNRDDSHALYRLSDGSVASASVFSCLNSFCIISTAATRYSTFQNVPNGISHLGWALVRPAAVPLPAAGWLFISAFTALFARRRLTHKL